MRCAVLVLCLPLLAQNAAETARIEGRVIDGEGNPVANATVRAAVLTGPQSRSANTAADGTFLLDGLAPAPNYGLIAQKPGFVPAILGAAPGVRNGPPTPFALAAGETARVELRLIAQGVITGEITNQSGDPVPMATVVLWQVRYRLGVLEKEYVRVTRTDDRGAYRIPELPAGRYIVVAGDTLAGTAREGEANLTTYYRGTQEFADATAVDLTAGAEVRADVALLRGSVYSMHGTVLDAKGTPLSKARVSARRNNDPAFTTPAIAPTGEDGSFVIHALMPGNYIVEPDAMFDPQTRAPLPRLAMSTPVTVGAFDADGVVLRPSGIASLTGKIVVDDGEWSPAPENRRVGPALNETTLTEPPGPGIKTPYAALTAMNSPIAGSYAIEVRADSTFEIDGVVPGEYRFVAGGFPGNYYVKSVRMGETDVTHAPIRVPSSPLTVIVSTKGAELSGTLARDGLIVALWPETENPGHPLRGIRVVNSTKGGAFQLRGVAPGNYRIGAFDTSETGVLWNYAFLSRFAGEAARVEVSAGATVKAEPPLVPRVRFSEEFEKIR